MIRVSAFGDVLRFDLARSFAGRGRYWTTAYYVDGLLVDSGCAHTSKELEIELRDKTLHQIVNTHSHEDHIGGNARLQRRDEELRITAHTLALETLENPRVKQPLQLYRKVFWGWPDPSHAEPIAPGSIISTEKYSFQVISTPGHSPDHICLYEPREEWIFTGDLFVGGKDRALRAEYDIWGIIHSLKKIAELPMRHMFPGSARVRQNPIPELREKIVYLESLGARVLKLHDEGWSPGAIARELCGGPMFIELMTFGHFSRRHLILSFLRGR
jgi:glyoxylase-like metal-dependent hydrolase (beta-lactamase superfamily II)